MLRLGRIGQFASPICSSNRSRRAWLVVAVLSLIYFVPCAQGQVKKHVLMINELGQSHPGPVIVTNLILEALHADRRFQVEFYWENLDAVDHSMEELNEQRDFIVQKYRHHPLDLIVLLGPDAIRLLTDPSITSFSDVPVVFCCSAPGQIDPISQLTRFTGSWLQLEPARSVDAALLLLPETRHVFVIAGQSIYDRRITALAKASLISDSSKLDITYLTELPMDKLQEKLRHLPSHSIVLFLTFFKDSGGLEFLGAADALPLVIAASNAPVFGISDTYMGRGIVGGFVVSFEEQGKIAARDVIEVLGGKRPRDIPAVHGPSIYMFDWRELKRWNMDQTRLPAGSTILFRQPTLWERHKWTLLTVSLIIMSLSLLTIYLLLERKKLQKAREAQEQLSGMLINAQEAERRRLAAEIHDDFSQRLAVMALGLGTAAQMVPESPQEANRQLQKLSNEVSRLGGDLHTLSHHLHSASLESLGLVRGLGAFCKEFSAQQDINVDFTHSNVPQPVNSDVALCVFRIVQEGLRNIKKYSGASSAQVSLQVADSTIQLFVRDQGTGFNPKDLKMNEGLGIRSMEERARLLGGRFEIRSKVGAGTTIDVSLPLEPTSRKSNT